MCRCYRDTKMEIQGLSEAPNVHCQHGVPRRPAPSPPGTTTGAINSLSVSDEIGARKESHELQSHNINNNNRPSSRSPFLQNGSGGGVCLPVSRQNGKSNTLQHTPLQTQSTNEIGFRNVNYTLKERERLNALQLPTATTTTPAQDFLRIPAAFDKYDVESGESIVQMALPFFEGEEELHPTANTNPEGFYVVFNIVEEDDANKKDRPGFISKDGIKIKGKRPELSCNSMEVEKSTSSVLLESDAENLNSLALVSRALRKPPILPLCNFLNAGSTSIEGEATTETHTKKQSSVRYETNQNIILTNEYGESVCGQVCSENIRGETPGELLPRPQSHAGDSSALVSGNADIAEAVDTSEGMDTSDFVSGAASLLVSANTDGASNSSSANETFSGTIMINNQSIIVTIENGILTLAAPPEGYTHKDDCMVSLKEHLGMKDHEDIVLLNYDSGTKSIGKISNVAVTSSGHSDSELALADDCSLSELGVSLDSCPVVKQEGGALCSITEGDLVGQGAKGASGGDCENNADFQHVNFAGASVLSKKGAVVTYGCPQPGCPSAFDTRQKLKVHLLNHTEDQRPFKCTFDACGWAFTTSYKLKRHLQSHDKVRPHTCEYEGCGRRFTTVYNLKAHVKAHDQENAFVCEICSDRFRSATRLTNHQRAHFEPERPHKCEFPGCEKTFITFSALFSHNRTHFRETGQFTCTYAGCDKCYDKACRLKIHMRSHTGERPFVCDSETCGWSFTSMSKLLRHKRKHDDDRRFTCPEEGCGKSFTRAEHLKGHSITHLGTKPFECHVEGCSARFSARSSLYIHSKKHKQDAGALRLRCPVACCSKHFSSRSSLKSHMLKHHHLSPDILSQLETTSTLTPSSELLSTPPTTAAGPGGVSAGDQLANLDLSSLFSAVPGCPAPPSSSSSGVGVPAGGAGSAGSFTMDLSLVSSGILTIDPTSVGTAPKAADPLILAAGGGDMGAHGFPPQGTLNLEDVRAVTPEALGSLAALAMQGGAAAAVDHHVLAHTLSSSSVLAAEPSPSPPPPPSSSSSSSPLSSSLSAQLAAPAPGTELLASPSKPAAEAGRGGGAGPLLGCVEALGGQQEGGKVLTQFVFPGHGGAFGTQKDPELSSFLVALSGGSARTDYRAIQLAKKRKQRGPAACSGSSGLGQRKGKGGKASSASASSAPTSGRFGEGTAAANGGLTLRDPVTGAQYVQIQLLQDDPASDGDLAFQLSSQPSSSHSQLTVDLPVNILQEPSAMTEDDNGSDNSQFTGSTINLQDLE